MLHAPRSPLPALIGEAGERKKPFSLTESVGLAEKTRQINKLFNCFLYFAKILSISVSFACSSAAGERNPYHFLRSKRSATPSRASAGMKKMNPPDWCKKPPVRNLGST